MKRVGGEAVKPTINKTEVEQGTVHQILPTKPKVKVQLALFEELKSKINLKGKQMKLPNWSPEYT